MSVEDRLYKGRIKLFLALNIIYCAGAFVYSLLMNAYMDRIIIVVVITLGMGLMQSYYIERKLRGLQTEEIYEKNLQLPIFVVGCSAAVFIAVSLVFGGFLQ